MPALQLTPVDPRSASPVPSSSGTPSDPELIWLHTVYQHGARQLTVRAVLTGMVLGAVLCLSNLYVVLKTGWSMGVTITACILAFGLFRTLQSVGVVRGEFTVLENNAMSSVASAAGYMTGGGNMAALPALLVLTGQRPDGWAMFAWFAVIALLGVFAAIPIKRQLINIEQVAFPTGTATAATLKSLHELGHGAASKGAGQAKFLMQAGAIGAVVAWLRDAKASWMPFNLPAHFGLPVSWGGHTATQWTLAAEGSLMLVGGGALMSWKTGWSMLLGAIVTYGFLAPELLARGIIAKVSYKAIVQWTLWPGASLLVTAGLLSFAFQWRTVVRSFSGLSRLFSGGQNASDDPLAAIECPAWWFPAGFLVVGPVVVWLMGAMFGIPWWAGVLALPLAVVMGVVAARVTGETDVTPTKALGPVTQAIFGGLLPGNITANIMSANVTGGVGLHAADLLTDLKSGYLLGANPRQQFFAQFFGVLAGSAVVVPAFNLLVPDASVIGSEQFPAPAVQVWAGVSKVLANGIGGLHPSAQAAVAIGALLGVLLTLVERFAPKRVQPFVPSASGVGVAMVVPGFNAVSFFLGALIAEVLRRRKPELAERAVVPVASGFIAGESLMGILVAMLVAFGVLSK